MKKIMFVLLFLLVISYSSFEWSEGGASPITCPTIPLVDSQVSWLILALAGLFLMFGIIVIVYLIGHFLNLQEVTTWGKNELWQIIASVILLVLLVALIPQLDLVGKLNNPSCPGTGSCNSVTLCGDPDGCTLLQTAYYYCKAIAIELSYFAYILFEINFGLEAMFSIKLELAPLNIIGVSFDFENIFAELSKITDWGLILISPAILSWVGNLFILCFASKEMLALFLPLGLVLRSFPTTRSVGGGLIALALGLYFVYPLLLNINNIIVSSYMGLSSPAVMINHANDNIFNYVSGSRPGRELLDAISTPLVESSKNIFTDLNMIYSLWGNFYILLFLVSSPVFGAVVSNLFLKSFYIMLQEGVYLLFITSFLLPVFNIFITFTFVQEIGKFLGSDMNLADLVKLI